MAKKHKGGKHKSSGGSLNIRNNIVPITIATITEPMVDSLVNSFAGNFNASLPMGIQVDDAAKVGAALFLGKKGGMVGKVATMYGIFGLRNIIQSATTGMLMPSASKTAVSTSGGMRPTF